MINHLEKAGLKKLLLNVGFEAAQHFLKKSKKRKLLAEEGA